MAFIDSRQIQYTVKVKNDPANAAAAAQLMKSFEGLTPLTETQNKLIADQVKLMQLATAQADARLKTTQAETALIEKQTAAIRQQATARAIASKATVVAAGGSFFGGIGGGAERKGGVGETARINSEGSLRLNLFSRLNAFVDIAIAGIIGNKVLEIADKFAELTGKIKINSQTEGEALAIRQRLIDLSLQTHSSLEQNVESWEKLQQVGKRYHMTENQVIQTQKTLFEGIRIGGASTERAQGVMEQFIMMLNRGRASGLGFNTIFRQSPEFMNMLAKAMNVPIAAFSTMGKAGRVSMDQILEGVRKVQAEVDKKFGQLPVTMRQGFQDMVTSFDVMVGQLGEKLNVSGGMGQFFEKLANVFKDPQFVDGVQKITDVIGRTLLKVLNALVVVIDFVTQHSAAFGTAAKLLGYYLEFSLAKGALKAVFGFARMDEMGKVVSGSMGLVQKTLYGIVGIFSPLMSGLTRVGALFGTTAVAAGAAAEAETAMAAGATEAAAATTVATGGLNLVAAAIIAGTVGMYAFGDSIDASGKGLFTLADVARGAWSDIKDKSAAAVSEISTKWAEISNWFSTTLWPTIVESARLTGLAIGTYVGVSPELAAESGWQPFPGYMQGIFNQVIGLAQQAAPKISAAIGEAWDFTKSNAASLPFGIGPMLAGAGALGGAWNQMGEQGRAQRTGGMFGFLGSTVSKAMKDAQAAAAAAALDTPLTGGVPVGNLNPGGKQKKDKVQEALDNLKRFVDETEEAIKEQNKLSAAMLLGPAAERQAQIENAQNKERTKAVMELDKVQKGLSQTAKGRAAVEAAASAAGNLELSKQKEARDKLTRSIIDEGRALDDETDILKTGMTAWTGDMSQRRAQSVVVAQQIELQKLLNKYKKEEYGQLTAAEKKDVDTTLASFMNNFKQSIAAKDLDTVKGLIDQSLTPDEQAFQKWDEYRLAVVNALGQPGMEGMAAKAQQALDKIKPPTNFMEALHVGMRNFTDDFRMGWGQVAEGIKGTISNLANSFIEMAVTGKFHFKQLALSVVQDLERMILKALIFKAVMGIMNAIFPGSGSVLGAVGSSVGVKHSGGIAGMAGVMRSVDPSMFVGARRFHSGGLAGLQSGEIPIIAKAGEAIMPTVRMPDGTFGVKAMGGGGGTIFAPNINIGIDAKGRGPGGGEMTHEQQMKLTQLLDDEINTHLQRKLEEWMRPGGPLQGARR